MKTILTIAALLLTMTAAQAQQVTKDAQGNYHAAKRDTANKATGHTFTDSKGQTYPVYESINGKLYYMRTSKSGNVYKVYIKEVVK